MGYNFDPTRMYQPQPPMIDFFDECDLRYHKDGRVESLDSFWPVEKKQYKGWNIYDWRGSGFRAYKVGWRVKKKLNPIILKEPPRNKYVTIITYKKKAHELGVFDTPEEATQCYLDKKEGFIQDKLRDIWTGFLSTR